MSDVGREIGRELGRTAANARTRLHRLVRVARFIDTALLVLFLGLLCAGRHVVVWVVLFAVLATLDWVVCWRLNPRRVAERGAR